jgi:hypothetical protein
MWTWQDQVRDWPTVLKVQLWRRGVLLGRFDAGRSLDAYLFRLLPALRINCVLPRDLGRSGPS